jgi:hypothetical protein
VRADSAKLHRRFLPASVGLHLDLCHAAHKPA